jgi:glycosyltransferase involved in cell wall biosynthesis
MLKNTNCLLAIHNYFYPRGGAEVMFLEQNRMFEDIGWQVVPFAMKHPKNLPTPWAEFFPDEIEFGASYSLAGKLLRAQRVIYSRQARQKMRELLQVVRPQIAHVHNVYHHLSPSVLPLLKERGIPLVMTVHDLKLACPAYTMMSGNQPCERCRGGKLYNVALHRCIKDSLTLSTVVMAESYLHRAMGIYEKNVDRFIVPSRFILEKLVQWGWARDRFTYIPNFVDIERFRPGGAAGRRFLYCGRLHEQKGVATLIRAATLAGQPITIAGTGPQEAELRRLAQDLGTDAIFTGHLAKDALAELIQTARAVIVPSECNDNAPMVVIEAYAGGRPVIGARIAGIPELVREEETGLLYPVGDVEALAAALTRFAQLSDARLAAMGAAGRSWVERDFNAARYRDRLIDLYESVAAGVPR